MALSLFGIVAISPRLAKIHKGSLLHLQLLHFYRILQCCGCAALMYNSHSSSWIIKPVHCVVSHGCVCSTLHYAAICTNTTTLFQRRRHYVEKTLKSSLGNAFGLDLNRSKVSTGFMSCWLTRKRHSKVRTVQLDPSGPTTPIRQTTLL